MCTRVYIRHVISVGIRELRADLAGWVRRAGRGDDITITSAGRPVCRLTSLDAGALGGIDQLIAIGQLLEPARRTVDDTAEAISVRVGTRLDAAVREARGR